MIDNAKELAALKESKTCGVGGDELCKPDAEPISVSDEVLYQDQSLARSSRVIDVSNAGRGSMVTNFGESFVTLENPSVMNLHWRDNCASAFFPFVVFVAFCFWGGRHYLRLKKQEKLWRDLSSIELMKIREHSFLPADHEELLQHARAIPTKSGVEDSGLVMKSNDDDFISKDFICSQNKYIESNPTMLDYRAVDASSCSIDQAKSPSKTDINHTNLLTTLDAPECLDTLSNVRARQQRIHEMNTKSAKQQCRDQRKLRLKQLLNSLQHDAANEAHRRRTEAIMQEHKSQSILSSGNLQQRQQTMLEELHEIERRTLLQQQHLEYLESLRVDQERAQIKVWEMEKVKMQQKLIDNAKARLVRSGVKLSGLLDEFELKLRGGSRNEGVVDNTELGHCTYCGQKFQVRLLLPSGRRFQGTFAERHTIGLLYDFALVLLDNENLLRVQEDMDDFNKMAVKTKSKDDSDEYCSLDSDDYSHIKSYWREMFHSFSIVSTYPQKPYNNLNATLNESGFTENATLMVVLESE